MRIDMDKFKTHFSVQIECAKLVSLVMFLNMTCDNYLYLESIEFPFSKESIKYLKEKYKNYIEIYEEELQQEINKTYRLN